MLSDVRTPLFNLLQIERNRMAKKLDNIQPPSMSAMNVQNSDIFHAPMKLRHMQILQDEISNTTQAKICEFHINCGSLVQMKIVQDWIKKSPKFSIDSPPSNRYQVQLATLAVS